MEVKYDCCVGLDVHKRTVYACVLSGTVSSGPDAGSAQKSTVRKFGTTYSELQDMVRWFQEEGVVGVAMESTGSYWMPVYNLLEGKFEVVVANAAHMKAVPGRKTDVQDAQWIADLLRLGLLSPSFIPDHAQRCLRELTRHRASLVGKRAQIANEVQRALESSNIKLQNVVTSITGQSALGMLRNLLEGETSPEHLAQLAKGRLRAKLPELEKALQGRLENHHKVILGELLEGLVMFDTQILEVSAEIQKYLDENPPLCPPGVLERLDEIPGINQRSAQIVVAESGVDMSRFRTEGHYVSWIGLCPGQNESGGKRRSGRTRKGNKALRCAFIEAAHGAIRKKDSYFGAQYSRIAARRGKQKALIAVAHSIAGVVYHVLKTGARFVDLGATYFDQISPERVINRMKKRAQSMGYIADFRKEPVPA